MKTYLQELKTYFTSRLFVISLLVLLIFAYGFAITNTSIGIDDLELDRYVGSGQEMLRSGRFGIWFWAKTATRWSNAYTLDLLGLGLFVLAAVNFCILFQRISGNAFSMGARTVFACLLVTNPFINEIWEYTGAMHHICGSLVLVSGTLLFMHRAIHERKKALKILLSCAMMTLVCAGYESVAAVYVFFVFLILGLQMVYGSEKEKKFSEVLRQGLIYAGILAAGLALRFVIHRLTLAFLDLPEMTNGATVIRWTEIPAKEVLRELLVDGILRYVLRAMVYFPVAEMLVSVAVLVLLGILVSRKQGALVWLSVAGMLFSMVFLSLIQGSLSYYRTCQVFWALTAVSGMGLFHWVQVHGKREWLVRGLTLMLGVLCLYHASFLNFFLTQNVLRSNEEAFAVRTMGTDLERMNTEGKPVIFVGKFFLSEGVTEPVSVPRDSRLWEKYQKLYLDTCYGLGLPRREHYLARKLPETNVSSVLNWAVKAYDQEPMDNLFEYYGFSFPFADFETCYDRAYAYAEENQMPHYPADGYIQDAGEFIVVSLGILHW